MLSFSGTPPRSRPEDVGTGGGGGGPDMAQVCPIQPDQAEIVTVVPIGAQANIHAIAAPGKWMQPCDPLVRYFGLPYGMRCHGASCMPYAPS